MHISKNPKFTVRKALLNHPRKSEIKRKHGDLGTPEIKARQQISIEVRERHANGEEKTLGCRVKDQTPMDRYFQRRLLDKENDRNYLLFQASERLIGDFYYSGLLCQTTSSYEPRVKSCYNFMEHRQDRLKRYKSAMKQVPDTLRPILVHVCCLQGSAHDWAVRNGHNQEAGIVVLRLALTELAVHYGMIKKDVDTISEYKLKIISS